MFETLRSKSGRNSNIQTFICCFNSQDILRSLRLISLFSSGIFWQSVLGLMSELNYMISEWYQSESIKYMLSSQNLMHDKNLQLFCKLLHRFLFHQKFKHYIISKMMYFSVEDTELFCSLLCISWKWYSKLSLCIFFVLYTSFFCFSLRVIWLSPEPQF